MRIKMIVLAAILFASLAPAQTPAAPDVSKTFDFTNKPSQQGLQEIVTVLRTVGDIKHLSVDPAATTVTVQGTPDEIALSGWIIHELDQQASPPPPSSQPFLVAGKSDDVLRVFHLSHMPPAPQAVQEVLTVLRTVADVQKVFSYMPLTDLVVRGPAVQVALAEYLINSLDLEKAPADPGGEFPYTPPPPSHGPEVVRVFYLANASTPQAIQELLTSLRVVAQIQKVFNFTHLSALAVRGSASDLAAADWLIKSLDIPARPGDPTAREFDLPPAPAGDNVIRVFYPINLTSPQALSETLTLIRTDLHVTKVFIHAAPPAFIVRGSADQIAKADVLIQDRDKPAGSAH
jgi:hypothetical protein